MRHGGERGYEAKSINHRKISISVPKLQNTKEKTISLVRNRMVLLNHSGISPVKT